MPACGLVDFVTARLSDFPAICRMPDGSIRAGRPVPAAILPGSFNPLHHGHTTLAAAAGRVLGVAVEYELSLANVDKPDLSADELTDRLARFTGIGPVWVTRAATFAAKAELFPGTSFVLGHDTAVRLIDPKYYGGDPAGRDAGLRRLLGRRCRVVVGGRVGPDGVFRTWDANAAGTEFGRLFVPLSATDFRADVSSTALRGAAATSSLSLPRTPT